VNVRGKDFAIAAGVVLLLAVAVVRLAVPDRSRIRPLSVAGLDLPSEAIAQGETVTREKTWPAPADVYVIGWSYRIGAPTAGPELHLLAGDVRLFTARGTDALQNPAFFPSGTAFLVRRGQSVTLRFRMSNAGPAGETHGASALVYFVPVMGN
jgi:hypothetical protein